MNIDLSTKTTDEVKAYGYELQKIVFAGLNAQQQLAIIEQELQRRANTPKETEKPPEGKKVV